MDYYIYKNDQNIGPLPESEVVDGLRNQRFSPDDVGCRVGDAGWKDLSFFFPLETAAPLAPVNQPVYQQSPPPVYQQPTPILSQQQAYQPPSQPLAIYNQPNHMQPPASNASPAAGVYQNGDFFLGPRFLALLIDALVAFPLGIFAAIPIAGIVGAPLLCLYCVSRDAIFGGQSIGKRVMGLRVVKANGQRFTWGDSFKRNIVYLPSILLMIPWAGHFAYGLFSFPLGIIEIILILTGGQRIGDRMGNTYVVRA